MKALIRAYPDSYSCTAMSTAYDMFTSGISPNGVAAFKKMTRDEFIQNAKDRARPWMDEKSLHEDWSKWEVIFKERGIDPESQREKHFKTREMWVFFFLNHWIQLWDYLQTPAGQEAEFIRVLAHPLLYAQFECDLPSELIPSLFV